MRSVVATSSIILAFLALPAQAQIETVAKFGKSTPPGNIAIGPTGRMFMSLHQFYAPKFRVVEVNKDGSVAPYPSSRWASAPKGDGPGLNGVLGLRADRTGILWMLDAQGKGHSGRVIGWNTASEKLHRIYYLSEPVTRPTSFLNDLAVDRDHKTIYISDIGDGKNSALIILDLDTGRARRVLEGSAFTKPEELAMVIDGRNILFGGKPAKVGVDPIALDHTNTWVYFAPMSGTSMYRVRTEDLINSNLSPAQLATRVKRYGSKPISDGSIVDTAGNVYITSMTKNAIGVTKPDGTYQELYRSDDLPWPDGFAIGPDGYIYATINELHRSPVLNNGKDTSKGFFKIVRFKPLPRP